MPRVKTDQIDTLEAFHARVDRVAEIELTIKRQEALRDTAIAKTMDALNPPIQALQTEQKRLVAEAETYALKHRKILLPGKTKSAKSPIAIYGFRSSKKLLCPKDEKVVTAAIRKSALLRRFSTVKLVLEKGEIKKTLQEHGSNVIKLPLSERGFSLTTGDTFYIQPKPELAEPKRGGEK